MKAPRRQIRKDDPDLQSSIMLETSPDNVDVWLVFPDEIGDVQLLDQYRQLLTDKERAQEKRFHFARDQHRYLVTRALVRTVLSRYARVKPEQWSFSSNAYGKPEIANACLADEKISFNVTHTHGLIVLGVASDKLLGVDAENTCVRRAPVEVARRYFSSDEVAALNARSAAERHDRFFEYWTLKEAYIKARTMGLSIPLDQFCFRFRPDSSLTISFHPFLNDCSSRWRFWQFRISFKYLMAICVENKGGALNHLNIKKIIPLSSEEIFACTLLRKSM